MAFNNASEKLKIRSIDSVKCHLSFEIMLFQRPILGYKKKFFDTSRNMLAKITVDFVNGC